MITANNILFFAQTGAVYSDYPDIDNHNIRIIEKGNSFEFTAGKFLQIMPGFQWDEASVPWIGSFVFPKSGIYSYSALVHDALYYLQITSRKEADIVFLKYMKGCKISSIQCTCRYAFVRLFGWLYWNKNINNPSKRCILNKKFYVKVINP